MAKSKSFLLPPAGSSGGGGPAPPTPPPSEGSSTSSQGSPSTRSEVLPLVSSLPSLDVDPEGGWLEEDDDEEKLRWDEEDELEEEEDGWDDNNLGAEGVRRSGQQEPASSSLFPSSFLTPPTSPSPTEEKRSEGGRILYREEEEERRRLKEEETRLSPQPQRLRSDDDEEKDWNHHHQHLHPLLPAHLNLRSTSPTPTPPLTRLNTLLQRFLLTSSSNTSPPTSPSLLRTPSPASQHRAHHPLPPRPLPLKLLLTLYHILLPLLSLLSLIALSLPLLGYLYFTLGRVLQQSFGLSFYSPANTALFWVLFSVAVGSYGVGGYRMILEIGRRLNGVWGWWEVGEMERARRERRWEVEEGGGSLASWV